MADKKIWWAIGDSFTYLNDHLDETGYRIQKGYVDLTVEKLHFPVNVINEGINGSQTSDWLGVNIGKADFYTILLGTNDWFHNVHPTGTREDYLQAVSSKATDPAPTSILGFLGMIVHHIRQQSQDAPIFLMNPVERGDFVCVPDPANQAHGSYAPEGGRTLASLAKAIYEETAGPGIIPINLHDRSGFTPERAVQFKRLMVNGAVKDVPYPDYIDMPYDCTRDPFPYPMESIGYTYDGLHPSDEGCNIISDILASEINSYFGV